jgi:hypothetical protein
LILSEDAPIWIVYLPASAIHAVASVLKVASSFVVSVNVKVCDWPGFKRSVLAKAFSSSAGLSILDVGALKYNCTTSLPGVFPKRRSFFWGGRQKAPYQYSFIKEKYFQALRDGLVRDF